MSPYYVSAHFLFFLFLRGLGLPYVHFQKNSLQTIARLKSGRKNASARRGHRRRSPRRGPRVRPPECKEKGRLREEPPLKRETGDEKKRQNHVRRVTRLCVIRFETATAFAGWNRETEPKLPEQFKRDADGRISNLSDVRAFREKEVQKEKKMSPKEVRVKYLGRRNRREVARVIHEAHEYDENWGKSHHHPQEQHHAHSF